MIKSLQSVRFIFALMIFLHHAVFPITALGAFPVTFFLILSGFVLMKGNNCGVMNNSQVLPFLHRRIRKVYPVHILCLLIAIVVCLIIRKPIDWVGIIPNIFLLHGWIPDNRFYFSGNSVSWYLSVIVFCYIIFPYLAKLIKRWRWRFMLPILTIYFAAMLFVPSNYVHAIIYINPLFRIVDFSLGVWLFHICNDGSIENVTSRLKKMSRSEKTMIEFLFFILSIVLILISLNVEKRFLYACYWWIPSLLIIFILYTNDENGGIITIILNSKQLVFLGSLSFVFYMLHIQILILNDFLMENVMSMNYYINGIVVLLVTIGLSYLISYKYMPLFSKAKYIQR